MHTGTTVPMDTSTCCVSNLLLASNAIICAQCKIDVKFNVTLSLSESKYGESLKGFKACNFYFLSDGLVKKLEELEQNANIYKGK